MDSMLLRISMPGPGPKGGPNPHPVYGDQLSERAITTVIPEGRVKITYTEVEGRYADGELFSLRKPAYAITNLGYGDLPKDIQMSPRVAPHMIGLGLLEAVPSTTLFALSDPLDAFEILHKVLLCRVGETRVFIFLVTGIECNAQTF